MGRGALGDTQDQRHPEGVPNQIGGFSCCTGVEHKSLTSALGDAGEKGPSRFGGGKDFFSGSRRSVPNGLDGRQINAVWGLRKHVREKRVIHVQVDDPVRLVDPSGTLRQAKR